MPLVIGYVTVFLFALCKAYVMMHGEGIYIYMYVYYWAQSDCITGRVEAVPVQVMY